jgi:hypothetical protein
MAFPLSIRGRLWVGAVSDPGVALSRVVAHLRVDGVDHYELSGVRLTFRVGLFSGLGVHHPLTVITRGVVHVAQTSGGVMLDYCLWFTQAFWLVTAGVLAVFGSAVLTSANLTWHEGALILAGAWLWLYGASVAATWMRFPRWLRAAVSREAAESAHPKTLFGSRSLARLIYGRRSD